MKQPSLVKFANPKLKEVLKELEKSNKQLYKFINQALKNIETDAFCGVQIPKKLFPKEYLKKYKITNLWKYDLPKAWRLIYTVRSEEITILSIIIDWLSHKDYERKFKY